jgi:hypothetical protein
MDLVPDQNAETCLAVVVGIAHPAH